MNQLLQLIKGRTVAVVGNGPVEFDRSAEIDAADVVIRFNHFYRLGEGTTGRKTDIVIQTFTGAWARAADKHIDVLDEYNATIFIGKKPAQYTPSVHSFLGPNRPVVNFARFLKPWEMFTTGGAFLCYLASALGELEGTRFRVYGFDGGAAWQVYLATDARHYAGVARAERAAVDAAIRRLEAFQPSAFAKATADKPTAFKIVIPVKGVSAGCPGKNAALLPRLLDKLAGRDVVVVGDDPALLNMATERGMESCPVPTPGPTDDVTATLRRWRDATGYCGFAALVQATTPGLEADWIDRCREALSGHVLAATACEERGKFTAIYREECGVFVQAAAGCGPTSRARQLLPRAVRLNGGVFAFHSDALDFPSFFDCGPLYPVVVPEALSLDVDTPEDLEKAERNTP